ncbi:glutathione S-transferase [Yoonia sp.]|uniref:glutathione S-transferase n=1 Tax=Yoonia sp. TaxID=2212373 RepID=UPI0025F180FC|nr:glutathione S-transferase [Yoonia sp.]
MTYQLYIGDRTFSSWSLRGWLMLEKFGLPYNTHMVGLYAGTMAQDLAHLAPARSVPVMQTGAGHVLTDSIAMAETLVENHPAVDLYPRDPGARALARSMVAEMHSGFMALRNDCPNMISHVWDGFVPSQTVIADIQRAQDLWALARSRHGHDGPWLFGAYSLADVFYAPVALRITAYGLPVSSAAQAYVNQHLADPAFLQWRAAAQLENVAPWPYPMDLKRLPWPSVNQS